MKHLFLLIGASVGIVLTSGCGSGTSGPVNGADPPPTSVTGNWAFVATPAVPGNQNFNNPVFGSVSGQMVSSGSTVAATVWAQGECLTLNGTVPHVPIFVMSGSVSGSRLDLTSSQSDAQKLGQALTVSGSITTDGSNFTGTYSVAGGCDDKDTGTITGTRIPGLSGTFAGSATLSQVPPGAQSQNITVSTALTQTTTQPNIASQLDGTITATGSSCFSSGTAVTPTGSVPTAPPLTSLTGGIVFGQHYLVLYKMDDGSQLAAVGTVDLTGKTLTNSFVVNGGSCTREISGLAPLTRQ